MKHWDAPERRVMRYLVPLAYHFHVRPWELDLLTVVEFDALAAAADDLAKDR